METNIKVLKVWVQPSTHCKPLVAVGLQLLLFSRRKFLETCVPDRAWVFLFVCLLFSSFCCSKCSVKRDFEKIQFVSHSSSELQFIWPEKSLQPALKESTKSHPSQPEAQTVECRLSPPPFPSTQSEIQPTEQWRLLSILQSYKMPSCPSLIQWVPSQTTTDLTPNIRTWRISFKERNGDLPSTIGRQLRAIAIGCMFGESLRQPWPTTHYWWRHHTLLGQDWVAPESKLIECLLPEDKLSWNQKAPCSFLKRKTTALPKYETSEPQQWPRKHHHPEGTIVAHMP